MTPVMMLSDGYIANGAEPWKFPQSADLPEIKVEFAKPIEDGATYLPYKRDEKLSRPWAIPGTKGLEHRIGGLEKANETGNISYDADNHEFMVKLREEKVERIADYIPLQTIESGPSKGKVLVVGWGSTYGSIQSAVNHLLADGYEVAHAHIRYLKPFPKNLGEILFSYDKVLVPEINNGQLVKVLRDKYMIPAIPYNKIKGTPITSGELIEAIMQLM